MCSCFNLWGLEHVFRYKNIYRPQLISDFFKRPSAEKNIAKLYNKKVHIGRFRWPL